MPVPPRLLRVGSAASWLLDERREWLPSMIAVPGETGPGLGNFVLSEVARGLTARDGSGKGGEANRLRSGAAAFTVPGAAITL